MPTLTKSERQNVVDAIVGELQRLKLGNSIAPGDVETLKSCVADGLKLAIDTRMTSPTDEKAKAKLTRRSNDIDAQLSNFKAFASTQARLTFWRTVDAVLTRLVALTIAAV